MRCTVFCVQQYLKTADRLLAPGRLERYRSASEAEDRGAALAQRSAGVVVYALTGDPEWEVWSEPEVFARHGEAPG